MYVLAAPVIIKSKRFFRKISKNSKVVLYTFFFFLFPFVHPDTTIISQTRKLSNVALSLAEGFFPFSLKIYNRVIV